MSIHYSSRIGVSEAKASTLDKALKMLGQEDENGDNISVVRIDSGLVQAIPIAIKVFFLVVILVSYFFRCPLGFLSFFDWNWLEPVVNWEIFSKMTWWLTLTFYLGYLFFTFIKNNIISGVEGIDIHLSREKKICKTIKAGSFYISWDPWVQPHSVVNIDKPLVMMMNNIEGSTRDQHTVFYDSALVFRCIDSHKMNVNGGFEPFIPQLKHFYQAYMNDTIVGTNGENFATFQIELIHSGATASKNNMDEIGNHNLSVQLLKRLSDIREQDISQIDLAENSNPERMRLITEINNIAKVYGLECIDHIPLGTRSHDEFFAKKAIPLVTMIQRLQQAVAQLEDTINGEADAEKIASVVSREIGLKQLTKIIKDMEAAKGSLQDSNNIASIVKTKKASIINKGQSMIGPIMLQLEGGQAQISSKTVTNTGIARYREELDKIFEQIEAKMAEFIPKIQSVSISSMDQKLLIPDFDMLKIILEKTGTWEILEQLKGDVESTVEQVKTDSDESDQEIVNLLKKINNVNIDHLMDKVYAEISGIAEKVELSTKGFTLENVEEKIANILQKAEIKPKHSDEIKESVQPTN